MMRVSFNKPLHLTPGVAPCGPLSPSQVNGRVRLRKFAMAYSGK
jgi:hypothetical protein